MRSRPRSNTPRPPPRRTASRLFPPLPPRFPIPQPAPRRTGEARQHGMASPVHHHVSSLPILGHVATALDVARLPFALRRELPHSYAPFSVQSYPYRGRILENHNPLLLSFEGADG